jgi:hypothetical protein
MTTTDHANDFQITKATRRYAGSGTWVCGRIWGHRFSALVFPEHAMNREWEIGDSRISKLWIKRLDDERTVFNWDRGADVPAADEQTELIVEVLTDGLADIFYPA